MSGAEDSYGAKDDNRMSGEAEPRSPPSVPRLQRNRDSAVLAFVIVNEAFEIKNRGGGFADSTEVMNARSRVDEAFNNLCAGQGNYAVVTGETWADIDKYKPGYMTDLVAHKKKRDAVFLARAMLEIAEARAAVSRALLWTLQMTREAEQATKRIRLALELAADVVRSEHAEVQARTAKAVTGNAAANLAAVKVAKSIIARAVVAERYDE